MKDKITKRRLTLGVFTFCLIMFAYIANAQNKIQNFGGSWALNEDKCDFGRLTAASASKLRTLTVEQSVSTITITSGDTTTKSSITISLEGKTSYQVNSTVVYGIPNTLKTSVEIKLLDSRSFRSTIDRDPLGAASSSIKTYSISEDGQVLTIDYKNFYGAQIFAGKLVYDKNKSKY